MSTSNKTPFRELIKIVHADFIKDFSPTRYHIRLGDRYPVIYSTDECLNDIRIEKADGTFVPVTDEMLDEKPWILKNLREELAYQGRKQAMQVFQSYNNTQAEKRRDYKRKSFGSRI